MDCDQFHLWLKNRDILQAPTPLDAVAHREGCPECKSLYALDSILELEIASAFAHKPLPQDLAEKISLGLDHEASPSGFKPLTVLKQVAGIAVFAGLIIALFLFLTSSGPSFKNLGQISEQAVADHLKGNWEVSFDTTTLYKALEMLKRELKFNVVLPDLTGQECLLVGGRLCALGKCRAAYFVLEQKGKKGSLFIMDTSHLDFDMADGTRFSTSLKGCTAQVWKENGQVYAMVF